MKKNKKGIFLIFSFLVLCSCRQSEEGSGSSGGDGIRGVFLEAKDLAVNAVTKSDRDTRTRLTIEVVSEWVAANQQALALDIQLSKHLWADEAQATCAVTERTSKADIRLSIPSCKDDINDKSRAAFLLVHESVHHFGIADEYFADQVARSVIVNLGSGSKEPHSSEDGIILPPQKLEVEFNNRAAESLDPFHVCHYEGIEYEVEAARRPEPRFKYFDGTDWRDYSEGTRVQTIGSSKFKIITNKFKIPTSYVHIELCPVIDIRMTLN